MLGCGTGVGKTHVSVALLREFARRGVTAIGLKPIESGIASDGSDRPPTGSDAAALALAGPPRRAFPNPLYALPEPISPHLAARRRGIQIELPKVTAWVQNAEEDLALHDMTPSVTLVESAGGVFSPLGPALTNFDLARSLEPAIWVLVAADALGVLHEVTSTLRAMRASGREPDHVVLSGAREPDASTGGNAAELAALGIVAPRAVLARNDESGISALVDSLLETLRRGPDHV